jgi:hypothetical protein
MRRCEIINPEPEDVACCVRVHGHRGIHWMETTSSKQTVRQADLSMEGAEDTSAEAIYRNDSV